MLKNLCYTVPTLGRISIGDIQERADGKRLPKKLDYFKVTAAFKNGADWVEHPVVRSIKKDDEKLREIPVRLMYSDPDLNLREKYEAFYDGRQVCVGDGEKARRRGADGKVADCECPGSDNCPYGKDFRCKPFGRLNVQIDGQGDSLSSFILRTRGINSIRTLRAKLTRLHGMLGDKLAGFPLKLVIRGKASQLSHYSTFYYVDIVFRNDSVEGLKAAVEDQKAHREALEAVGFNFASLEQDARSLLANGAFEESEEEMAEYEDLLISDGGDFDDDGDESAGASGGMPHGAMGQFAGIEAMRGVVAGNA